MDNTLTTKDKWEAVWTDVKLPVVKKPVADLHQQFQKYLPQNTALSLIEIGCAPGGWMAYFSQQFGYRVSGLEYAETAAKAVKSNMKLLAIDANVLVQDIFTFDCAQNKYDIVFSAGFIEHFRDLSPAVERIVALSRTYVVTIVPNMGGVNGFISKTIRPKVYAEHNPIDVKTLDRLHTNYGTKTLFCNYVGGMRLFLPGAHNDFFNKHKYCAKAMNAPTKLLNCLSMSIGTLLHYAPRSKLLSESLLYIGLKENT